MITGLNQRRALSMTSALAMIEREELRMRSWAWLMANCVLVNSRSVTVRRTSQLLILSSRSLENPLDLIVGNLQGIDCVAEGGLQLEGLRDGIL